MTMVGQAQASPRHLGAVWEQALGIGCSLPGGLGGWGRVAGQEGGLGLPRRIPRTT